MYKIANWNLERPKSKTEKTKLAIEKIQEVKADIIVLTETSKQLIYLKFILSKLALYLTTEHQTNNGLQFGQNGK